MDRLLRGATVVCLGRWPKTTVVESGRRRDLGVLSLREVVCRLSSLVAGEDVAHSPLGVLVGG